MSIKASEISDLIKARIDKFEGATEARNVGTVVSVTDGIVRIHGLADARYGEMLEFDGNIFGLALNLEHDSVGAVVLGDYKQHFRGRRGQDHGPHSRSAGGSGTLGPRGRCAGQSHRRQGSGECQAEIAARARGAGRDFPQERVAAGADRPQGHRLHGADRPRPARAHHRRPPDRQDRGGHRHHHQSEGHGR